MKILISGRVTLLSDTSALSSNLSKKEVSNFKSVLLLSVSDQELEVVCWQRGSKWWCFVMVEDKALLIVYHTVNGNVILVPGLGISVALVVVTGCTIMGICEFHITIDGVVVKY